MHYRLIDNLSKRERQIIHAMYGMGPASVADVKAAIPDAPGYSAVRAMMNILVRKRVLSYRKEGRKHLYFPLVERRRARQLEVRRLLEIYFKNSVAAALSGLIWADRRNLTDKDYADLIELIQEARTREPEK